MFAKATTDAMFMAKSALLWLLTPRSPDWPHARAIHLAAESVCQWCGGAEDLQVHHIVPFHLDKSKELDQANMITLCMDQTKKCHYRKGHKGVSWLVFEPNIRQMCDDHKRRSIWI